MKRDNDGRAGNGISRVLELERGASRIQRLCCTGRHDGVQLHGESIRIGVIIARRDGRCGFCCLDFFELQVLTNWRAAYPGILALRPWLRKWAKVTFCDHVRSRLVVREAAHELEPLFALFVSTSSSVSWESWSTCVSVGLTSIRTGSDHGPTSD